MSLETQTENIEDLYKNINPNFTVNTLRSKFSDDASESSRSESNDSIVNMTQTEKQVETTDSQLKKDFFIVLTKVQVLTKIVENQKKEIETLQTIINNASPQDANKARALRNGYQIIYVDPKKSNPQHTYYQVGVPNPRRVIYNAKNTNNAVKK